MTFCFKNCSDIPQGGLQIDETVLISTNNKVYFQFTIKIHI